MVAYWLQHVQSLLPINEVLGLVSLCYDFLTPFASPISQEAMKQTYQRALKAATDFGYQKESPE